METLVKGEIIQTNTAISKDGTAIVYDKTGKGPGIILVNGALAHRKHYGEKELALLLANNFTVIFYDRRGRGESTDTKPYTIEREIEDIETLIKEAGGSAYLYGVSSGAALALLAAENLGPEKISKLALYEPPYGSDTKKEFAIEKDKIKKLAADSKPADAVTFFMERRGTTRDEIEIMKKSPEWNDLVNIGPTLVYDFEILGDGTVPIDIAKNIVVPTLVIDGEKSFDFIAATADNLGKIIPAADRKTIKDQTHEVSPGAIAPVLLDFFSTQPTKMP